MEKKVVYLIFFLILLLGLCIRIFLVDKVIVGDLLAYAEWGEKFFSGNKIWTYSVPNYPPLAILIFTGINWLWEDKFVLAQTHNFLRFPPALFIIYFYKYGDVLLLKLLPIISDLALGIIVFRAILTITKKIRQALFGMAAFILNPISIFISGAWGQTDSFVALFGILAFMLIKNAWVSIPIFAAGILIKPSWMPLAPFFVFLLFKQKLSLWNIVAGFFISAILFILVLIPFSGENSMGRFLVPLITGNKVSVSAFNFFTIFYRIDKDLSDLWLKGFGVVAYLVLNAIAMVNLSKMKNSLLGIFSGLFIIGLGSFIFTTGMLERYFFPGLIPLIILMFSKKSVLFNGALINLILFANIIWSFYRRGYFEIAEPFTNNNYLLIRILSIVLVALFVGIVMMLQSKLWKKKLGLRLLKPGR